MNSITFQKDLLGVQNDLLRFAYKLTSDREEANDLLQETSLKALVYEGLVANHLAIVIDKDIAHDGIHPSFEICIRCIFFFVI